MDSLRLKQRIVGAIVLVGLGVIFIPMILSGGRDSMPLFGSNIPDKPRKLEELQTVEIPARPSVPEKPLARRIPVDKKTPIALAPGEISENSTSKAEAKSTTAPRIKKETADKSDKTKEKPAKAWVVQVGSFSNRGNAMKLRDKLRNKHHPAFVELVKGKNGQIYRVRVGPDVTRTLAEERMRKLRDKMKIYGVVMRHP